MFFSSKALGIYICEKIKKDKEYTAPSGAKKSGLGRGGGHTDF